MLLRSTDLALSAGGRLPRASALLAALLLSVSGSAQTLPDSAAHPSSTPMYLTVCGQHLVFAANDGLHGVEPWIAAESGECKMLADIAPKIVSSNPRKFQQFTPGKLMFSAETPELGFEPWIVDCDANTVMLLANLAPGRSSSDHQLIAVRNGRYLMSARTISGWDRFLLTGSVTGGVPTAVAGPWHSSYYESCVMPDGTALCPEIDVLYHSGWTRASTVMVREIDPALGAQIDNLVALGNGAVFRAMDAEHGMELWFSDATFKGTRLVKDIAPGPAQSAIGQVVVWRNVAFFQADNGVDGLELWRTDGTTDGTWQVKDINPGQPSSDPHYFTAAGSALYFCADDGEHGIEMWMTDGTPDGTVLACDVYPGPLGSEPWSLCSFQNRMFFCAAVPEFGEEIFSIAGVSGQAQLLRNIVQGSGNSGPDNLTNIGDRVLFFTCTDSEHGEELWSSRGDAISTQLVRDINPPRPSPLPSSTPHDFAATSNGVVFGAYESGHGDELWVSTSSTAGTSLLQDIYPGETGSKPAILGYLSGRAVLAAQDPVSGREPWITDGTQAGTQLLKDVAPGAQDANPRLAVAFRDKLIFVVTTADQRSATWSTDGTTDGTLPLGSLSNLPGDAEFCDLFCLFEVLYAYLDSATIKHALIKFSPENNLWNVLTEDTARQSQLRSMLDQASPQSEAGSTAFEVELVLAVHPPPPLAPPSPCAAVGSNVYFVMRTPRAGAELWRTNGTPERTQLVKDIYPGPASSSPSALTPAGEALYFIAEHPVHGRILWKTTGDASGTDIVLPLNPSNGLLTSVLKSTALLWIPPANLVATVHEPSSPRFAELRCTDSREILVAYTPLPPGAQFASPVSMAPFAEFVAFGAEDALAGNEPYLFNRTLRSVTRAADIAAP